ncbi:SRPBCC family protein [Gracilibacillus alcaliphilus]|uniref:SRPBCC family protein n=1 Tax=Gracilibacillus alcaliphilus TaxID=1401441 RepID=UPI0019572DC4|nr:SRPBCC family protein [Gracilibacillus alcaliphilus]MBM7677408.1 uncharacterized protein YndB with AHSA1/START domain [Gracilibacillus alcaliphilus]
MLAVLEKTKESYTAVYQRPLAASVQAVWSVLTENDQLQHWMPNLEVADLRKGGTIKFHMNDGTGEAFDIAILDFKEFVYLQFEWGEGSVRFELTPQAEGCLLRLTEYLPFLNDHTPKDLAGWHVCLDMFQSVLKGEHMDFPEKEWAIWYEKYMQVLQHYR